MPTDISHKSFQRTRKLTSLELEELVVKNNKKAFEERIRAGSWKQPCAVVAVQLATNNSRILKPELSLLGALKGDNISAARLWPEIEDTIKIRLTLEDLSILDFGDRLNSDLLDLTDDHLEIKKGETTSSLADLKKEGAGDLSCRVVCYPTNHEYMKVNAIIYPYAAKDLTDAYPAAANPLFPGFMVVNKDVTFMPTAKIPWGLPFYCFICKGDADKPLKVGSHELNQKLSRFLRDCFKPNTGQSLSSLSTKWTATLGTEGESALPCNSPPTLWPQAPDSDDEESDELEGRNNTQEVVFLRFYVSVLSGWFP